MGAPIARALRDATEIGAPIKIALRTPRRWVDLSSSTSRCENIAETLSVEVRVARYSASPSEKPSTSLSSASASGGRKEVPANESASMRATGLVRR
jgi:hypothetical protein